jgi:hypothetical protein
MTTHDNRGPADGSLTLPQEKGLRQRKKSPSKQPQYKANHKAGQPGRLQSCSPELEGKTEIKLPNLTEGEADQAAAAERQKKKSTIQPPIVGETTIELLLKYKH